VQLHLNKYDPTWLQNLACDIPEANWHINNIASHPVCNARHAETAPGLKKFEKLHSDKMQIARCAHRPALGEVAPLSHHSKPGLALKIPDLKSWTYTDSSCHIQGGKTVIGAGVYHHSSGNSNLVEPNGVGITNTIGRAELAAIAAAITYNHIHIATDSLTSLHQIKKLMLYPEKHCHHVQEDILELFQILPTSSFTKLSLMQVLPEMNVQTPLQNTKPAPVAASQLKQPSAPQALAAIPSLILAG